MLSGNRAHVAYLNLKLNGAQAPRALMNALLECTIENSIHLPDMCSIRVRDLEFEWLEKAYQERSSWLTELGVDPVWADLHSDPRYADLIRRVGLPE